LVYGHEIVFPIEINLISIRIQRQNEILVQDYCDMVYDELNVLYEECLIALKNIICQKEKLVKNYNKKVKKKYFRLESYITYGQKLKSSW